jgi:formylglycine-generating enzyme required for sulfatase activity
MYPTGPTEGQFQVYRGGSFSMTKEAPRVAVRGWFGADSSMEVGFRVACNGS